MTCHAREKKTTPAEPAQASLLSYSDRTRFRCDGIPGQVRYRRGEGACVDTARLTRHAGVQGRRRVGGAATDSPSYFSSLWAPGASRPKMAGGAPRWHPAHGRPILQRPGGQLCAAYAAGWRILLLRVRFGPQKLNQLRRFCFTSGDRTPPGPCVPHGGMPAALLAK